MSFETWSEKSRTGVWIRSRNDRIYKVESMNVVGVKLHLCTVPRL